MNYRQTGLDDEVYASYKDINKPAHLETYELKKDEIHGDRERVYEEIVDSDGITLKEIADRWGCPPNCISGRITELRDRGFIRAAGKKLMPNYRGRVYPHTVWEAVE